MNRYELTDSLEQLIHKFSHCYFFQKLLYDLVIWMTFLMIYGAFAFLKASVPVHYNCMEKIFKHSPLVICKRKFT